MCIRDRIKGRVLENSLLTAREAADALAEACDAETVQTIGSKFVLYKKNAKEPKIDLVKDKKKREFCFTAAALTRRIAAILNRR